MVKGAALLLPAEEPLVADPPPAVPPGQVPGQQEQHLQLMMQLLRPQDAIRLVGHGHPRTGVGMVIGLVTVTVMGWRRDGDSERGRMGRG